MAKKILIVDDDSDIRTFLTTVLEECGHVPITAANGEEGLKRILNETPDMVLLDVLMPRRSGIRLYRELKTNGISGSIPIIIISAITKQTFLGSQEALSEFDDEHIPEPDAYLEKPVEPQQLAETINRILM